MATADPIVEEAVAAVRETIRFWGTATDIRPRDVVAWAATWEDVRYGLARWYLVNFVGLTWTDGLEKSLMTVLRR